MNIIAGAEWNWEDLGMGQNMATPQKGQPKEKKKKGYERGKGEGTPLMACVLFCYCELNPLPPSFTSQ
jgi:hypothetical protein